MYVSQTKDQIHLILEFIKKLADYEKRLDEVIATEESLRKWIFEKKQAEVIFALEDGKEIAKISTTETATMIALISTIQFILLYLVSVLVLPLLFTSVIQTLMFTGQATLAYGIYQLLAILSQPTTILMLIFGTFIITFVFVLIGAYIYNILAKKGRGVILNLGNEGGLTAIESIEPLKLAIAFAIICGILSLIVGIISVISGGSIANLIGNVLGGFVGGFIEFYLIAIFYNFLAPKIGKIKLELIDFKIN